MREILHASDSFLRCLGQASAPGPPAQHGNSSKWIMRDVMREQQALRSVNCCLLPRGDEVLRVWGVAVLLISLTRFSSVPWCPWAGPLSLDVQSEAPAC